MQYDTVQCSIEECSNYSYTGDLVISTSNYHQYFNDVQNWREYPIDTNMHCMYKHIWCIVTQNYHLTYNNVISKNFHFQITYGQKASSLKWNLTMRIWEVRIVCVCVYATGKSWQFWWFSGAYVPASVGRFNDKYKIT